MLDERPNILLITTDQQRYDTTGPMAPAFIRTPHLGHLEREGISFTSTYSDAPICVPSRVSLMTGKYVSTHGMTSNGRTSDVIGRHGTLPARMRQLGYQTAAIGKMHFGPQRVRHGFDEMILPDDYYRYMRTQGHSLQPMRHGLGQNELYPAMATVPESQTLTSWIAEQCVEYIRDRRDPSLPFFLWCSFSKPHPPLDPPEPYYSMYRDSPIPEAVYGDWATDERSPEAFKRFRQSQSYDLVPPEVIRDARAAYYGLISQIDYNIGRVFAALLDLGMFEDALILYTSDHGEYLGDHHAGGKTFFHEPSAHVPLVLRLPKHWDNRQHGTRVGSPVTLADVLPTLVAAAGGTATDVDGQDLTALAQGRMENPRRYLEAMTSTRASAGGEPDYMAITDGVWKYIWYPEGGAEQLFDLNSDPQELRNLAGADAFQSRLDELRSELVARHEARGSEWVREGRLIATPERRERVEDRRNRAWPGYHTDRYDVDVRH